MAYEMNYPLEIQSSRSERATFIRRTYAHLAGAILALIAIEAFIFGVVRPLVGYHTFDSAIFGLFYNRGGSLLLMVAFIGVSFLAHYWAFNGGSQALQYAGLSLYVLLQAFIFLPLLCIAMFYISPDPTRPDFSVIAQAGILTMCLFAGLTATVFLTGKDFSFLGPILAIGFFVALGTIVCAICFGFTLGLWFSLAMIVLAAGAILYDTSNILYKFRMDQHVAAALSLFASVAMLFYYVLVALLQSQRR
jgi:FtsH-binding integral membrane protein